VLQNAVDPSVRANLIIALGDLAFRFPNLIDPWSSYMYNRLRDKDTKVRKNALMVLTHLILNDMVKVKETISEIAMLLEDKVATIADLARLFFSELSKKGRNPIYNILPDVISRLSADSDRVKPDQFQRVLAFLLDFIDKDKQQESLVDKLCLRFNASNHVHNWRNIAYCLSRLSYPERCFAKISDTMTMKCYTDKLADDTVFKFFIEILAKCKRLGGSGAGSKPEVKAALEDFEKALRDAHNKKKGDDEAEERAVNKKTKPKPKPVHKKKRKAVIAGKRKRTGRSQKKADSSDEDSPDDSDSEEEESEEDDDNLELSESNDEEEEDDEQTGDNQANADEELSGSEDEDGDDSVSDASEAESESESGSEASEDESESDESEPEPTPKRSRRTRR